MDYERQGFPVELRSRFLLNIIYQVDDHISKLEELVQEQEDEISVLLKEKAERSREMLRSSQALVASQLSQILAFSKSEPPINKDMGLDTVLILKHLEGLIYHAMEGDMYPEVFLDEVKQYVEECMQKAKLLPTGGSNEQGEG